MSVNKKTRAIGILGGSFDPIHLGHLSLALEVLEKHKLDEVWLCPASKNPLKSQNTLVSDEDRLEMVRLAIRGIPGLKCKEIELQRPPPSYTIDTLEAFYQESIEQNKPTKFYLILGEDSAETFFDWKQPEDILKLATIIVGQRNINKKVNIAKELNCGNENCSMNYKISLTRYIEISSTEIRARIQAGLHVEHLLPWPVWKYIKRKKLYKI